MPAMRAACQELLADLVDESAGQILPALRDPAAAAGQVGDVGGSLPPEQAACFADPAFVASLPATVEPIENAFTTAAHVTGLTALAFVLLGFVFSLLLPDTRHPEEKVVLEPEPGTEPERAPA
jgi:hypothetical protein